MCTLKLFNVVHLWSSSDSRGARYNARGGPITPGEKAYIYSSIDNGFIMASRGCDNFSLSTGGPCKKQLRNTDLVTVTRKNIG